MPQENQKENRLEIELKFKAPAQAASKLAKTALFVRSASQFTHTRVLSIYYDTPDHFLSRQGLSLRLRKHGNHFFQSIKSAGRYEDGLYCREEWEIPLDQFTLDLTQAHQKLTSLALPGFTPDTLNSLIPLFETDFTRKAWQIKPTAYLAFELALDHGEIRTKTQSEPIDEIEIELKHGEQDDMLNAVALLREQLHLHPFEHSKAARGFSLLKQEPPLK
jgi:triphosphatase